jgi:16S rRNA (guanine527-N7)-methyltransferase
VVRIASVDWPSVEPALRDYHDLLAGAGVERGLLGPREVPRLWERHILNCAVAVELVPRAATVVDVGSGAGLPGLVWALARPDLSVTLLEPLLRRATFLTEAVAQLASSSPGLPERVQVRRGRAEDREIDGRYQVVTARAVAPLGRLAGWTLPLVEPGGQVLALKGAGAESELADAAPLLGADVVADVIECGLGVVDPPTRVVRIRVPGGQL